MIVVVARPTLERSEVGPDGPGGLGASIAVGIARRGARVELVGSVGDDEAGDRVVLALEGQGIGHAALLRDPSGATPVRPAVDAGGRPAKRAPARLEAADVDLGLRYLPDCRVLVMAEILSEEAERAALDAGGYHGASVIGIVPSGTQPSGTLERATVLLEAPEGAQEEGSSAFAELVAELAARLDRGEAVAEAFWDVVEAGRWRSSG